ncbi:putative acyl-CoA desaturase [Rosa chinensis]|uniref:Putative acyl-CoA desaturase n=1 Tax=Rosa chinensis TaxID=74649 RepID=A0A2P6QZ10_ROSCH|nr:putative acyl-CoA desaturase [Rosa chinensis]
MGGLVVSTVLTPFVQFWGRSWNLVDIITAATSLALHGLCLFAPFHFTWAAFWVAVALYILTGLGVTLGFHRHLAHKSLRLPKWLEYLFAYFGVLSLQGSPIEWVSTHRYHHQFTDTKKDPHSPLKGFWFSHMGWILDSTSRRKNGGLKNVEDMKKQWFYRFLHRTFVLHVIKNTRLTRVLLSLSLSSNLFFLSSHILPLPRLLHYRYRHDLGFTIGLFTILRHARIRITLCSTLSPSTIAGTTSTTSTVTL